MARARRGPHADGETSRVGARRDQPRRALGRRPWFAFERRARSLRRLFFAIAGSRVSPGLAPGRNGCVVLAAGTWRSPPVAVATTAAERRRGLRPRAEGRGLLLRGRVVHGFGMKENVLVVAVLPGGVVGSASVLCPRHLLVVDTGRWVLELPADHPRPPPGARLTGVWLR